MNSQASKSIEKPPLAEFKSIDIMQDEEKPVRVEEIHIEIPMPKGQYFHDDASGIIQKYIGGDFRLPSPKKYQHYFLFGKNTEMLLDKKASELAQRLICAEEEEAVWILKIIEDKPYLANCYVKVLTPQGQPVWGSFLQFFAMLGDVDVHPNLQNDRDRGMVERIKKAANLSDDIVAEQLAEVITSEKAVKANQKRNKHVLDAIKVFGNAIIQRAKECQFQGVDGFHYVNANADLFQYFPAFCKEPINALINTLKPNPNEAITAGLVSDLSVLYQAIKWFQENLKRFGGWGSTVSYIFWENGISKLQAKAMPADARVILRGIGNWDRGETAPRLRKSAKGFNNFYSVDSGLGSKFYPYYGCGRRWATREARPGAREIEKLVSIKNTSFKKLMRQPDLHHESTNCCLVM